MLTYLFGLSVKALSKYEKGQSVPTLKFFLILKWYSGRRSDWIVTGEEKGRGKVESKDTKHDDYRRNRPDGACGSSLGLAVAT
jgi:hypothetical protein